MKILKSIYVSIILILLLCACTISEPISSVYIASDIKPTVVVSTPKLKAEAAPFIKAEIVSIIDGDTIKVSTDGGITTKKIRLLCINAEESVHSDESRNNSYGEKASSFLKDFMSGFSTVWLQYDVEPQDVYARELCYVWLTDQASIDNSDDLKEHMLNAVLLKEGYVYTVIYEPNSLYADIFLSLETESRKALMGLWKYEEFCKIVDGKR